MRQSLSSQHQFIYTWTVWKFTLPIIALVGYSHEKLRPETALWRLINILLGVAIETASTNLILPVATEHAVRRKVCIVLEDLGKISAGTTRQFLGEHSIASTTPFGREPSDGGDSQSQSQSQSPSLSLSPLPTATTTTSRKGSIILAATGERVPTATSGISSLPQQQQQQFQGGGDSSPILSILSINEPQVAIAAPLPSLNLHVRTTFKPRRHERSMRGGASPSPPLVLGNTGGAFGSLAVLPIDPESDSSIPLNGNPPPSPPIENVNSLPLQDNYQEINIINSLASPLGSEVAAAEASVGAGSGSGALPGSQIEINPGSGPPTTTQNSTTPRNGLISPFSGPVSPNVPMSPTTAGFYMMSPRKHGWHFRHKRSRWMKEAAIGQPLRQLLPMGHDVVAVLTALAELEMIMGFEEKAFRWPFFGKKATASGKIKLQNKATNGRNNILQQGNDKRLKKANLTVARRAMRRMLNALLSFAYVLDGPDVPHLRLLLRHRPDIDAVMVQMSECFKAIAGVASGKLPLERIALTQGNLREEVQELLLDVEKSPAPLGCTQADVVLGFAALGVLVAAVQTLAEMSSAIVALCVPFNVILEYSRGSADGIVLPAVVLVATGEEGADNAGADNQADVELGAGIAGGSGRGDVFPEGGRKLERGFAYASSAHILLGGPSMMDLVEAGTVGGTVRTDHDDEDVEMGLVRMGQGD